MNRPITRLFALFVLLFAVLIAFTSRWSVLDAKSLENKTSNRRPLLEEQRIPRGLILADHGERIAVNERRGNRQTRRYVRRYPLGPLFGHPVGYSFVSRGRSGLEKSFNDALVGQENELSSTFGQLGGTDQGDDVHTTLDVKGQRAALQGLGGRPGSVVAIEPSTGRIRVMVSVPSYDPNAVPDQFRAFNSDPSAPLFNRATQARYPPGSTFKVVTAAAALDTGRYTPDSLINGHSPQTIGGVPLRNFSNEQFGDITLTEALTKSVNTVFGQIGQNLGKRTLFRYMRRFGFNREPPLDYPSQQLAPSGVYGTHGLLGPNDAVDVGRVAIGQERLQVTPLQMAMVASAVANRGSLMRPQLVERVVAPDGRTKHREPPREMSQVMSPRAAAELGAMMGNVVKEGTGTAAALQGIPVAGKTGTAEVQGGAANQAWFIAFTPIDHPKMAIAVTIERAHGTGGEVAGPVAKAVLESLIGGGR